MHKFQIFRQVIFISGVLLSLNGCSHVHYPGLVNKNGKYPEPSLAQNTHKNRVESLRHELAALHDDIDAHEARQLAEAAIGFSMALANRYRLTRPPILHNILVNLRLRDRGLCIHWAEDLLNHLRSLELKNFHLYWGVAHPKNPFRLEHSSVVVTAKGQPFEEGLVLDGWRHSGELFWVSVKKDTYDWKKSE